MVITGVPRATGVNGQVVIDHRSLAGVDGFVLFFLAGALNWRVGTGAGVVDSASRVLQAADVGKLARIVCVTSVTGNSQRVYWNAVPGASSAIAAYSPGTATAQTFLGDFTGGQGLTSFEVLGIALRQGYAFTAADVKTFDKAILGAGRIPEDYSPWSLLYQIDQLNSGWPVLNAGGRSAGLGLSVIGTPIQRTFDQTLPSSWGPSL